MYHKVNLSLLEWVCDDIRDQLTAGKPCSLDEIHHGIRNRKDEQVPQTRNEHLSNGSWGKLLREIMSLQANEVTTYFMDRNEPHFAERFALQYLEAVLTNKARFMKYYILYNGHNSCMDLLPILNELQWLCCAVPSMKSDFLTKMKSFVEELVEIERNHISRTLENARDKLRCHEAYEKNFEIMAEELLKSFNV